MYNAGVIYQLSQDDKYAHYVRDMLLEYAKLYPTLDVHPKRKVKSQNPGKLFWQSLNEAMWLVYTIQAYDLVHDALSAANIKTIENYHKASHQPLIRYITMVRGLQPV